jgi:HAD superfamily hydrolase (TIGR01509 family)
MPDKIKVILVDFSFTICFPKNQKDIVDFVFNQELLNYLVSLKSNHKIYLFTAGVLHTEPSIAQKLQPIFDGIFTTGEIGISKYNPNSYKLISNKLNVNVDELLFIDDQKENVQAAITAGASAVKFENTASTVSQITKIISDSVPLNYHE